MKIQVCDLFRSQFDGDEMNLHSPQSVEAATELREIAAVSKQLISPRLSKPLVSIVQDTLVGVNRLTRPTEFFTRREFMNLLVNSKRWDGRIPPPAKSDPMPLWSGQQVVSALLPAVHIAMGNKMWDEAKGKSDPNYVIINSGTIQQGILDGDVFDKALIHILYNDFSPEMTVDFIDGLQSVVATYLQNAGFSVGLSDLIADTETLTTIAGDLSELKKKIESLQLQVHMGLFDNASGRTNQEEFESKVFSTLDKSIAAAGKTGLKSLAANNRMVNMVKCGSKGSDLNIAQMIALLGQQSIEGKRIAYGFQDRTLPHFKRYDDGADARGFIESSFVKGLTPAEFFFHAMTGREGLIDTAVKSVTGDTLINIRLSKDDWRTVSIGDWIDGLMTDMPDSVEHSQPANLELLRIPSEDAHIWTADDTGKTSVAIISAVTRHDAGKIIYNIATITGQSVTVSSNKSLLILDAGRWTEKAPAEITLADVVPVIVDGKVTPVQIARITAIPVTDPSMKLYDLTVPSTLNFAIANGLVVRDTADSGYMQRQLVKTMEDLMTYHDGSVRDAGGLVVQFSYGDDGTSATKIENQPIALGKMSDADIRARFAVDDVAADKSQAFLTKVFTDRDLLVTNVWGGRVSKTVQSAVHLPRLISDAIVTLALESGKGTPVTGAHVLDTIDRIIARTKTDNALWAALLRYNLNPRDIQAAGFTRPAFDWLAEQIVVKHMRSWAAPGEMAGIISAQSLGEPTTQMSSHKSTLISVRNVKNTSLSFVGKVGSFVDKLYDDAAGSVIALGDGSSLLDLPPEWEIMGVSNDEKASWKPISQVSRHPANGGLVKVTTKSGRSTTATLTHSFLRRTTTGIAEVKGSDLKLGDRVPVAYRMPEAPCALTEYNGFALTKDFGWLVGIYLADGSFSGTNVKITKIHPVVEERIRTLAPLYEWHITVRTYSGEYGPGKDTIIHSKHLRDTLMELCNTGSYDKCLSAPIFHANRAFIAGLLSGYFDGDGNVNAPRQQIRAGSRSETLIRDIARLLAVCGVFASIKEETSVRFPGQTMYTVNVIRKHAAQFQKEVGLCLPEKASALAEIVAYNARDDAHSAREDLDLIPELGDVIAETGTLLHMPANSRTYGRYASDRKTPKTAIGRRTLEKYIVDFRNALDRVEDAGVRTSVEDNLVVLESAANSDVIWDEITALEILPDPHEMVYDFTVPGNDSFMVDDNIFVHNTLNSVDWDTEIIIARDGKFWTPRIGEFIDAYIADCERTAPERIQRLPNEQLYVSLEGDGHDWKALSPDENGKMMWTRLEAITKHPVVNEDGTNTILEVELESGRSVRATKAKSFLRFEDDKIVPCNGSDLKIGDKLPVAAELKMEGLPSVSSVSLRDVLPATEWLYGSEVAAALAAMTAADAAHNRHWFSHANGKVFTVPYGRSDAFREAFTGGKNMHAANIRPGFVYPKKLWKTLSQIPVEIPLDTAFGFFCGAYLAEGNSNDTQVMITNNEEAYLAPIRALLDAWEVGHHTTSVDKVIDKTGIKGHTQSLVIHSTLLAAVMSKMFGRVSYEKTFPDWVFQAPDEFVAGLVDGYISGDGHVAEDYSITVGSVSEALMQNFSALMARYGIFTTHRTYLPAMRKFDSVSMMYYTLIPPHYAFKFGTLFGLTSTHKQLRLAELVAIGRIPRFFRDTLEDVVLDAVKSIKEVTPKNDRVYDLTVSETRNFTTKSCLPCRDTFHLSGVAAKSGMTRGVPRLKELLKVTANPKATSLTIPLRRDIRGSKEEARRLAQELEFTMLKDLVTTSRIYYDPRDATTLIADDAEWLQFYGMFELDETTATAEEPQSPWIIRLELNREKMFNKNITMEDINYVLRAALQTDAQLIYTDHNASRMVVRIRLGYEKDITTALDALTVVKQAQNRLLTQTLVRGLPGLTAVSFRKLDGDEQVFEKSAETGKYEPVEQFVLDTFGTNFLDVLIHPDVDGTRLMSNFIHDIYDNLGIEAARQVLFKEIFGLFESAAPVNYRHVALLCDAMCNRGRLMSADRAGVNKKLKIGPLAKASFEQTEDIMLRAALFGEMDPVTGVSANIMTGQPIRGGTSFTQVLLDESAMMEFMASAPPPRKTVERAPRLVQEEVERLLETKQAPGCRTEDLRIPTALPPMEPAMGIPDELPELEIQLVDE